MTVRQHSPGWFIVAWSLSDTLLVLSLVRLGALRSPSTDLANPGRVNARYHFMKPSRIALSRIEFRDEIKRTRVKKLDQNLKEYRILLGRTDASIEVVAENTSWIEW